MSQKFWPNRGWMQYWVKKKAHARHKGVSFTLSKHAQLALTESFPGGVDQHPGVHTTHLGRIDHTRGYESGNVQWESATWNNRKGGKKING